MRSLLLALGAAAMAVPLSAPLPVVGASQADAKAKKRYHSRAYYKSCRYSKGTTGLVAGGVTGAVVGGKVIGGVPGVAVGAVGGALAGRAADRTITAKKRCRYIRRR